MSKKFLKTMAAVFALMMAFPGFAACGGGDEDDIQFDDEGNIIPSDETVIINYWGVADKYEEMAMEEVVASFNEKYEGIIEVVYTPKSANGYNENFILNMMDGPDVAQVDEQYFKNYVDQGVLEDISSFYNKALTDWTETSGSKGLDADDMIEGVMDRYRYNPQTTTSNTDDPLYAVTKDLTPTGIFYNKKFFTQAGITVVEETEESIAAYNKSHPTSKKIIKAFYQKDGEYYFNKSIAMNWEECIELSNVLMSEGGADYGFFTEWWFNYAFSVGGDCIEYVETEDSNYNGGFWKFTLNDNSKNYIVKDDASAITVNGNTYQPGEIVAYTDKAQLTATQKASCNELPSQREAFTEFVRLSQPKNQKVDSGLGTNFYGADANGDVYGYAVTPAPDEATEGKAAYFTNGKVAMLATTAMYQRQFAELMGADKFDVAPMLQYKEYSEDGTEVLVHGIEGAHSQSEGVAMNANSNNKNAAWVFMEYVAGKEGQEVFASTGQSVPYYGSLAFDEEGAFLTNQYAADNSIIFANATMWQTPGDWWYLKDNKWIVDWSGVLNTNVRNGDMTLTQFYTCNEFKNAQSLLNAYTKK